MDHSKHILGSLCRNGHESSSGSGGSWRHIRRGKVGPCVICEREASHRYSKTQKGQSTRKRREERPDVIEKRRQYDALPETKRRRGERQQAEEHRAYQREYRKNYEMPEKSRAKKNAYMASPAVKAQQKAYRSTNVAKAKVNERLRRRLATDETFALVRRLRCRLAAAFRRYSQGGKTQTSEEYGVDYHAIIDHVGPCPGPRSEWHLDHVRPLSSFDWDDPRTPAKAFAPENHQWLPLRENLSKGSLWIATETLSYE